VISSLIKVKTISEIFDSTGVAAYHCAPMSACPVPVYVDTRKVFTQRGKVAGFVSLERLGRFRECLASETGTVQVELQFDTSDTGLRIIWGHLQAHVTVLCQRCLEPLVIALQDDIKLALLKDEAEVASLDEAYDPWICADTKLLLADLIEEQLMLCLPIVSVHEPAECSRQSGYVAGAGTGAESPAKNGTVNPFAVLKSLKESD
jgi:uncharacterized protein